MSSVNGNSRDCNHVLDEEHIETLEKIKDLEEKLRVAKKEGIILNQTPFLVVGILNGETT